jgi:hypothetical protein
LEWKVAWFTRDMPMNDETLLTLHCPACRKLVEVITESGNLVCLECGSKFDDAVVARFMGAATEPQSTSPPAGAPK